MPTTKILLLVGMPGAGKSFCTAYLRETKHLPTVYFGGVIVDEVKARGLEVNEANEKKVRMELRATEGKEAVAKRILRQIDEIAKTSRHIVADGLYTWPEYKLFKEKYGDNAIVVAIAAPRKVRHERLENRPDRPFTEEQVISREYAEIELMEKGGPIANADYTITNNSTTEDLLKNLEEIIKISGF